MNLLISPAIDPVRLAAVEDAAGTALHVINAATPDQALAAMPTADAFFGKLTPDLLAAATPQYWPFWLGLILVLLVLFVRGGIMGLLTGVYARLTGKGGAA